MEKEKRKKVLVKEKVLEIADNFDNTHETFFDKHYFYQDTRAACRIFEIHPKQVIDLGSTALLVGIISQFVPTVSIDIRSLPVSLPGLTCKRASITDLPFEANTIEFLSSMSVIEHVGLGRYGDKIRCTREYQGLYGGFTGN